MKGMERARKEERTNSLERLGGELLRETERTRARLEEEYYIPMAEQALRMEKDRGELEESVLAEIDSLQRASRDIREAYQAAGELTDELGARLRDTRASRDRKWYALNPPANGAIDLVEERREHFARGCNGYKLLLICFTGSFLGVVLETLWCLVTTGRIESRAGLVYGPFNLLYGAGAMALTAFLIVDAAVSCVAVGRWAARCRGVEAGNAFWAFVDTRFPDARMSRIFANMTFG